jgi:hypothetical protein
VDVRVLEDGTWTDWTRLELMDEGPDAGTEEFERARVGTTPLLTSGADGVEARLSNGDAPAPLDAQLELVDGNDSPGDASLGGSLPMASAQASAELPSIVSRASWGADESLRNGSASYSSTIKVGVVHHTASTSSYTSAEAAGQVRAIYAYHTNSLGWNDIGYNFLVDKFGRTYEGRAGGTSRPVVARTPAGSTRAPSASPRSGTTRRRPHPRSWSRASPR